MSTPRSLHELAAYCGAELCGKQSVFISGIAGIESAKAGDIVFAEDEANLQQALRSSASAVIAGSFARQGAASKPILISAHPKLAFVRISALLIEKSKRDGHSESAQIDLSAQIGEHVWIGGGAVVEEAVKIGDSCCIGANSVLCRGIVLGRECHIGPNVTIHSGTELGDRVMVQAGTVLGSSGFGYVRDPGGHYELFPQVGRLVIEDDVDIGANCTIDHGALDATVIRRGSKLDNMVHVGHNVEIGEDVVIAAQAGISGSSRIGTGAIIGGQVGIGEHAEVGPGTILGGQSGILNNKILRGKGQIFWGTPARPLKDFLKQIATLARLARKKDPTP